MKSNVLSNYLVGPEGFKENNQIDNLKQGNYLVSEVAKFLRCKTDTVYKMIQRREIPYIKIKSRILFPVNMFHEWYSQYLHKTADEIRNVA